MELTNEQIKNLEFLKKTCDSFSRVIEALEAIEEERGNVNIDYFDYDSDAILDSLDQLRFISEANQTKVMKLKEGVLRKGIKIDHRYLWFSQ